MNLYIIAYLDKNNKNQHFYIHAKNIYTAINELAEKTKRNYTIISIYSEPENRPSDAIKRVPTQEIKNILEQQLEREEAVRDTEHKHEEISEEELFNFLMKILTK